MKRSGLAACLAAILLLASALAWSQAPELKTIKLNDPSKTRGLPVMQALALRASVREWSDRDLSLQDLSDLLWAANGVNRPDGRRTAPSAMNAQDIDIYVLMKDGAYKYDAAGQSLAPVAAGDFRMAVTPAGPPGAKPAAKPQAPAPILLVLVSDISRFTRGETEGKLAVAALDAGIVSENIGVFCAGTGLATRPRATMDKAKLKEVLKLTETQYPLLNHPVGYPK